MKRRDFLKGTLAACFAALAPMEAIKAGINTGTAKKLPVGNHSHGLAPVKTEGAAIITETITWRTTYSAYFLHYSFKKDRTTWEWSMFAEDKKPETLIKARQLAEAHIRKAVDNEK